MKFKTGDKVKYTDEFLKGLNLFPPPPELGAEGIVMRSRMAGATEIVTIAFLPKEGRSYTGYAMDYTLQKVI